MYMSTKKWGWARKIVEKIVEEKIVDIPHHRGKNVLECVQQPRQDPTDGSLKT